MKKIIPISLFIILIIISISYGLDTRDYVRNNAGEKKAISYSFINMNLAQCVENDAVHGVYNHTYQQNDSYYFNSTINKLYGYSPQNDLILLCLNGALDFLPFNASLQLIFNYNQSFGTVNNFSFISYSTTNGTLPTYFDIYYTCLDGTEYLLLSYDRGFRYNGASGYLVYPSGNLSVTGITSEINQPNCLWNKTRMVVRKDINYSVTAKVSNNNQAYWAISDFWIDAKTSLNDYPVINSFHCNQTAGFILDNTCYINSSDAENDTMYYALSCNSDEKFRIINSIDINTDFYYDLYSPNESQNTKTKGMFFDYYNKTFIYDYSPFGKLFNDGRRCNYSVETDFDSGYTGFLMDYDNCEYTNISIDSITKSLGLVLYDYELSTADKIITKPYVFDISLMLTNQSSSIIDFTELYSANYSTSLALKIRNNNGFYNVSYSNNNEMIGFIVINSSIQTSSLRLKISNNYDTKKADIEIYDSSNKLIDSSYSISRGLGVNPSGISLYDYDKAIKIYPENNESSLYVSSMKMYYKSFPAYFTDNNFTCNFKNSQNVTAIAYVTDSVHGLNDYSNFAVYNYDAQLTTLINPIGTDSLDNAFVGLMGNHQNKIKNGVLLGLIFIMLSILWTAFRNGTLSSNTVTLCLFAFIILSIPLIYFKLLHSWVIVLDALIFAIWFASYFNFLGGGKSGGN